MSGVRPPVVRSACDLLKRRSGHADPEPMPRHRSRLDAQQGMTLVELMIAATVLVVGMLAVAAMVGNGFRKNTLSNQRVAATNLARELVEAARTAPYDSLTPLTVEPALKAANGNLRSTSPWKVQRRNTIFSIRADACTYDDPGDKLQGSPPVIDRCPLVPGAATTEGDQNGDDFRRVTFEVAWKDGAKKQAITQTALVVNPAGGLGPRIVPPLPTVAPVTSATQATVNFPVSTTTAASLRWTVDDAGSAGDASGGPTSWSVSWPIGTPGTAGAVPDGTYTVGLQAFSDRGIPGDAKAVDVTLNRTAPLAPTGFAGGHDTRAGDWVDFEWSLNPERDVIGYRVYDAGADKALGGGDDVLVCPTAAGTWLANTAVTCQDFTPRAQQAAYYLVALDRDSSGQPRQGTARLLDVGSPSTRPDPPTNVTLEAGPSVTWTPPGSGSVAFYRVYRDGTGPEARVGKLPASPYTDASGGLDGPHDYYVSAVDDTYNESDLVGPLHWSGP